MRLLLDTHILLWWLADDPALSKRARMLIGEPDSEIFVSAATAWEIAIKRAIGKLDFPTDRLNDILAEGGFTPLAVTVSHAVLAGDLPRHHGDPFDRMLVAQACLEGLTLITTDPLMRAYAVAVDG